MFKSVTGVSQWRFFLTGVNGFGVTLRLPVYTLQMNSPVRIDKWLWAARFFKTRSMAREAISGGKVHLNGYRIKPGRALKPGDHLSIQRGEEEYLVEVIDISSRRGPASVAQKLYQESEESRVKRELRVEQRKLEREQNASRVRRPDKRQRRRLVRFKQDFD